MPVCNNSRIISEIPKEKLASSSRLYYCWPTVSNETEWSSRSFDRVFREVAEIGEVADKILRECLVNSELPSITRVLSRHRLLFYFSPFRFSIFSSLSRYCSFLCFPVFFFVWRFFLQWILLLRKRREFLSYFSLFENCLLLENFLRDVRKINIMINSISKYLRFSALSYVRNLLDD